MNDWDSEAQCVGEDYTHKGRGLVIYILFALAAITMTMCAIARADVTTTEVLGTWTLKRGTSNIQTGIASYEACRAVAQSKATTTVVKYSCNVSNAITVKLPNGTATITWVAPTRNTDGSALTDLAGYMLYHNSLGDLTHTESISIPAGTASYVFTGLPPDTHYFGMTAVNSAGVESDPVRVYKDVK